MSDQCCCRWGAARGGRGVPEDAEWPEFECAQCPVHQQGLGPIKERCKRHQRERDEILARGTASWRRRVEADLPHHGLGPSRYYPGNVSHLVQPIVGMLRLMERDNETPDADDVTYMIDRLAFVLELTGEKIEEDTR